MFKKNLLNKMTLIGALLMVSLVGQAEAPKYPALREWRGQVWLTGKDGKRLLVRGKQVLREKAFLETSLAGQVKVQLDAQRTLTLLEGGELSIPVISWESGEAPVVMLKKGELHWQQSLKTKGAYNVALRSDLFEFIAPAGDYILSINPAKAFASVKMYEGSMQFSALNGEESVLVKAGQQVGFQGVLEGGEIAYDVLLKGKKIPRGQLTAVTAVDMSEIQKAADVEKKRLKKEADKKLHDKAALAKAKSEGYICEAPLAKFNECAWVCLNNPKKEKKSCLVGVAGVSCVRRRCNANGEWAEETVLDAEKAGTLCRAQPVVAPCDY